MSEDDTAAEGVAAPGDIDRMWVCTRYLLVTFTANGRGTGSTVP